LTSMLSTTEAMAIDPPLGVLIGVSPTSCKGRASPETARHGRCTFSRITRSGDRSMPDAWSEKRERQYEHIKESYEDRGVGEDEAEERAARTVNKDRREAGETQDED
jgi:hypothetical protein